MPDYRVANNTEQFFEYFPSRVSSNSECSGSRRRDSLAFRAAEARVAGYAGDFADWVAERGSKFLSFWDSYYEPLLETRDAGQDPRKAAFCTPDTARGVYIYNAYAFYRQLPEGVPGRIVSWQI